MHEGRTGLEAARASGRGVRRRETVGRWELWPLALWWLPVEVPGQAAMLPMAAGSLVFDAAGCWRSVARGCGVPVTGGAPGRRESHSALSRWRRRCSRGCRVRRRSPSVRSRSAGPCGSHGGRWRCRREGGARQDLREPGVVQTASVAATRSLPAVSERGCRMTMSISRPSAVRRRNRRSSEYSRKSPRRSRAPAGTGPAGARPRSG